MAKNILIAGENVPALIGLKAFSESALIGDHIEVDIEPCLENIIPKMQLNEYQILFWDLSSDHYRNLLILKMVVEIRPSILILLVGTNRNITLIKNYFDEGAVGYICLDATESEFKSAIYKVSNGYTYFPEFVGFSLLKTEGNKNLDPFFQLSKKEFVVFLLLLKGMGTKEISAILNLKLSTTSTYKKRIFKKLNVINIIELATLAIDQDVVNSHL